MPAARCSPRRNPPASAPEKYDTTAVAMIALLKYGTGMPFNRMERLESTTGDSVPGSHSVGVDGGGREARSNPILDEFIRQAAQGSVVHNDDTGMRILKLVRNTDDGRTGTFTSGIVSIWREWQHRAVLYRLETCGRESRRCSEATRGGAGCAHSDVRRVSRGTRQSCRVWKSCWPTVWRMEGGRL